MPNFTFYNRPQIEQNQAQKEVTANNMMEALAKATGVLSKAIVNGTNNLSQLESEHGIILLTGALSATATVVQEAATTKPTYFQNLTTGGQTVQVRIGAGTLFTVPANSLLLLLSTTDAILFGSNTNPLANATTATPGTSEELSRVDHRHPRDAEQLVFNTVTVTWTDQPAALTEFLGLTDRRTKYDLTQFTQVRLIANVEAAGAAGSNLRGEYSTDQTTWNDLEDGGGVGPEIDLGTAGLQVSSFVNIPAGAKADVFLRIIGIDGDAVADPQIGLVALQFK